MTEVPSPRGRALLAVAVTVSVVAAGVVLFQSRGLVNSQTIANSAYVVAGALLVLRRPGNRIGPLLVVNGVGWMLVTAGVVTAETLANSGNATAASWVVWTFTLLEPVLIWLMPALMLLFPSGYPESVTRRRLLRAGGVYALLLAVPTAFAPPSLMGRKDLTYPHPFIGDADRFTDVVEPLVTPLILLSLVAAIMLVARARHSGPVERRQIEWLGYAAVIYWFVSVINVMVDPMRHVDEGFYLLDACGMILMPIAVVIAIMKYRLYEIDTIISKSVTYLGLAASITVLYVVIVVVPLLVIGLPDEGGPGLFLPIAATAAVAVLFEPIRTRMQRWANRLVYGNRATPHEVLSQLTARLSDTGTDGGTTDLARLLAEGTGAEQAVVWLRTDEQLVPDAVWPPDDAATLDPVTQHGPDDGEYSASEPVRHGGQSLGALSITKPHNDPVTPADSELLDDVAAGAGLMLRNIALNRELENRAVQVRESRRRLIAAQDAERHRLERDLHDGAQQQIVALKVKLGLAKAIAQREGADEIVEIVDGLATTTQDAVDAMRAVAHGIYPPLLEAEGLAVALNALTRTSPLTLTIDATDLDRYPRHVEETIYFCVLEALNQLHMAGANNVRVHLTGSSDQLDLTLVHDGPGTDLTDVTDRIDANGGTTRTSHHEGTAGLACTIPTAEHTVEPA